jgi:feruloyl esterase
LIEAEFYPNDFDGIVAGDPVIDVIGAISGWNWKEPALFKTPHSWLPPQKIALLDRAVMRSCDATDGVIDGLIQDPRLCTFNPSSLECSKGESAKAFFDPNCLSAAQIAAVNAVYEGARTKKDVRLYPGLTKDALRG